MAQTGYTPISIYYSATSTNVPTAGNLVAGELAINTADGKLFYKDSAGVVQVIAGKSGAGVAGGSNTQVQYNSSGSLAGSSNFVWDNTNGRLGIGTSSPSYPLQVAASNSGIAITASSTNPTQLYLCGNGNTAGSSSFDLIQGGDGAAYVYNRTNQPLYLGTNNTTRLTIASAGTVSTSGTFLTGGIVGVNGSAPATDFALNINASSGVNGGLVAFSTGGTIATALYSDTGSSCAFIGTRSNHPTAFLSNNTERMRIDTSGNVGIGTTDFTYGKLAVNGSISLNSSSAARFAWNNSGAYYNWIESGGAAGAAYMRFAVADTERMRINVNGNIALSGATTTATGIGITFPATQSASSDANCLDDYEEGTWTPVIAPASGLLTTYSSEGKYVKVGQMVTLFCAFTITIAGTASGTANWSGAPFTAMSSSLSNRAATGVCRENAATGNTYQVYANAGGTTGDLITLTNGAISWTNGYTYIFTITYRTAA